MKKIIILILSVFLCLSSGIHADQATLDAQQDAFVSEAVPTIPTGPEGYVAVAHDWETGLFPTTKGLIQFDVLSLGAILDVQQATLKLHMLTVSGPGQAEFLRAGGSWDEYVTTWNSRPSEDRGETALGNVTGTGLFEVDVTDIVESWTVYYYPNNGFYIDVPDNGEAVDFQFASKEHASAGNRPQLEITYTPGGGVVSEPEPIEPLILDVAMLSSGSGTIMFSLPERAPVLLRVFDASGSLVEILANEYYDAGEHNLSWNASPGVYFVQMIANDQDICKKAVVAF